MANYPTLITKYSKHREQITKTVIDRAEDGTARGRSFSSIKHRYEFLHQMLSAADKAALEAFHATNRLLQFTYTSMYDSVAGEYLFAEINYVPQPGDRWNVNVKLEEA